VHAVITAIVLWSIAIALLGWGTTQRDPFGQLKWTDFVQFYTLGHIARLGPASDLYDADAFYRRQVSLVPASAPERYLPVYPPQTALLFAPLSGLGYLRAAALWALVTAAVYGVTIWLAWRSVRGALRDRVLMAAAAAAFPAFWSLILHGQTTAIPILAFTAAGIALTQSRPIAAGALLGLLLMKPQFGLMVAVVVLACREWRMLAGLVLSALLQAAAAWVVLGSVTLQQYGGVVRGFASARAALEPSIDQMHSLAAITQLLPSPLSAVAWLAASAWVAWLVLRVWRSDATVHIRMAALVMGSVLVNPHVYLYDVSVLAVPLVWVAGWLEVNARACAVVRQRWYLATYALFICLLAPTARVFWLQLSPFVVLWFLHSVAFDLQGTPPAADEQDALVALA